MKFENMQGLFLEKKFAYLYLDSDYEKNLEILESLFSERKFYAYSYISCLLIVLKQRDAYGIENIEEKYIRKVLETYKKASRKEHRQDFKKFTRFFRTVLCEAGNISLCYYIHIKMQYYLSIYYKHHDQAENACKTSIRYLNNRLQLGIYANMEEIIVEIIVFALYAIEMSYLTQAKHILNAALSMTEKLGEAKYPERFQRTVLREFITLANAVLIAKNLCLINLYRKPDLSKQEKQSLEPFEKYYKISVEVEQDDVDITPLDVDDEGKHQLLAKFQTIGNFIKNPIIADLKIYYYQLHDIIIKAED